VTQNRRMAASMGHRDPQRVDALTFGLGSGIAGIAGVALSQIDKRQSNLGQSYIIDSFMVVVFGRRRQFVGHLGRRVTLCIANKFLEPVAGAVLGKIAILVLIILFIQKRPRGLVRAQGTGGGGMMPHLLTRSLDRGAMLSLLVVAGLGVFDFRCQTCCCHRARHCRCRPIWWRCSANMPVTRCSRSRST